MRSLFVDHSSAPGEREGVDLSGISIDWAAVQEFFPDAVAWFPLAVAGVIVWTLWLYRVILSRRYRAVTTPYRTTTSVVVPSFHEDPRILLRCLGTWLSEDPDEVIIVLDIADIDTYDLIVERGDPRVVPVLFEHAGKRSALGE